MGSTGILISQGRKPGHRGVKQFAQSHTAGRWHDLKCRPLEAFRLFHLPGSSLPGPLLGPLPLSPTSTSPSPVLSFRASFKYLCPGKLEWTEELAQDFHNTHLYAPFVYSVKPSK